MGIIRWIFSLNNVAVPAKRRLRSRALIPCSLPAISRTIVSRRICCDSSSARIRSESMHSRTSRSSRL